MERNHLPRVEWLRLIGTSTVGSLLAISVAFSAGWDPGDFDELPDECLTIGSIQGVPVPRGQLFVGETIVIDADHVKLVNEAHNCDNYHASIPEFTWDVNGPPGSTATLVGTDTLTPELTIDEPGPYTVFLTPCPLGCSIPAIGDIPPQEPIQRSFNTARRPAVETVPMLPPVCDGAPDGTCMPATEPFFFDQDEVDDKCLDGGGLLDPQWVTVEPTIFADDYASGINLAAAYGIPSSSAQMQAPGEIQAVEGFVRESKISSSDSRLNHDTQDVNYDVVLDPIHRRFLYQSEDRDLMTIGQDGLPTYKSMHNEWEHGEFNLNYAPTASDRVSSWGHWIHDCGHAPFVTEIHAPVGVVAHRKRAVPIPPDQDFDFDGVLGSVGTGVWVPGVISEVWFNRVAGKMGAAHETSLAQPCCTGRGLLYDCPDGSIRPCDSLCPDGSFGEPREIEITSSGGGPGQQRICQPFQRERIFSFNIYLPRSPKQVLEEAGVTDLPEIPLYVGRLGGTIPQDRIDIERIDAGGSTRLHVRLDLRDSGVEPETLRIASAWVYPDAGNWGLRRWRFQIPQITVFEDADGLLRRSGEWNLWVTLNNARTTTGHREWTMVIDQDVDSGDELRFGGRPWSTGPDVSADRSLGPDLLLFDAVRFPEQRIHFGASGYEYDGSVRSQDKLELVALPLVPQELSTFTDNVCKPNTTINPLTAQVCGRYRVYFDITDEGPVGGAVLSEGALALVDAYTDPAVFDCPVDDDVCPPVLITEFPDRLLDPTWHPVDLEPGDDEAPFSITDTPLFELQEVEENAMMDASPQVIAERVNASDLEKVDTWLRDLRGVVDAEYGELPEVLLDVQGLRAAIPPGLWHSHFGDLPHPPSAPGASPRRMTGGVHFETPSGGRVSAQIGLHCDPVRFPNQLNLQWDDDNSFELDLITNVECDEAPEPMVRYRGMGVGRFNGAPGAVIEWTLEDNDEPGRRGDRLDVIIHGPDGEVVLEESTLLDGGNLQGHLQ
ncbi:MAG: hypothetical protein ACYTGC_08800 [Planctomycetota bacterium]|jgi:hypothetical protein